jgi:hypothetical protein
MGRLAAENRQLQAINQPNPFVRKIGGPHLQAALWSSGPGGLHVRQACRRHGRTMVLWFGASIKRPTSGQPAASLPCCCRRDHLNLHPLETAKY